jgi:small subunit ribosomal protein S21|tara:strand:+ start:227 stop:481 length:255 start_codon:yes stop_codon:yes gene_type:complete
MTHKKIRISVEVQRGNVEKSLRILKKKVNAEGIIRDLKKRQYYEKPSDKRRRQKAQNIARIAKRDDKLYEEWLELAGSRNLRRQ